MNMNLYGLGTVLGTVGGLVKPVVEGRKEFSSVS
jgi:hypothetical protein